MKLLTIAILSVAAVHALPAEDTPTADLNSTWNAVAIRARDLVKEGKPAEAVEAGKRALQMAKRFGPLDFRLGTTYHLLGAIYRQWGHCAEARSNYAHALAVWRRRPDIADPYISNTIVNLIGTMCECDDYEAAEKTFRTYQAKLNSYSPGSINEARLVSLKAVLARNRKEYAKSESLFRQSINLLEKLSESTPLEIMVERSNLAVVLDKEGHHEDSLAESQRTIDFLAEHAPHHPSLLAALNNAACSLADLGRRDESERMFQRALAVASDLYGEDNHVTAKIMLSYARVLRENKQTPAAMDFQKRGMEAFRNALVKDTGTVDVEEMRPARK